MPNPNRKYYASAPEMLIDIEKSYSAVFKLAKGGADVVAYLASVAPASE